jgi:hypothetical protein
MAEDRLISKENQSPDIMSGLGKRIKEAIAPTGSETFFFSQG